MKGKTSWNFFSKELKVVLLYSIKTLVSHLKMLLEDGKTRTRSWKMANERWRNTISVVVASTRHHRARLLKYYRRPPCARILVKSRMITIIYIYIFFTFSFVDSFLFFFPRYISICHCKRPNKPHFQPRLNKVIQVIQWLAH